MCTADESMHIKKISERKKLYFQDVFDTKKTVYKLVILGICLSINFSTAYDLQLYLKIIIFLQI